MKHSPGPGDVVNDQEFERLLRSICVRPGMWVTSEVDEFGAVYSYISGFDHGRGGAPLVGFQQWLVLRMNGGNNIRWPGTHRYDLEKSARTNSDRDLLKALLGLILEFLEYRRQNGLTVIFRDYASWLIRHSWYDGPLRKRSRPSAQQTATRDRVKKRGA